MLELSRVDARRLAVRAQLLDAHRPSGMFDVVRRLTMLQHDPANAVAPSADLVLWSRLGSSYSPAELADALDEQALLDLHGLIRVPEDLALYRAEMAEWPGRPPLRDWQESLAEWVDVNDGCRLDILARLRTDVHAERIAMGVGPVADRATVDTWTWPELAATAPAPAAEIIGVLAVARHWRTAMASAVPFARYGEAAMVLPSPAVLTEGVETK